MIPKNQLFVSVQNHNYESCKAEVTFRMTHRKDWEKIPYNESQGCYMLAGCQPGTYEIKVSGKKGWLEDHRTVDIKSGNNYLYSSIAPEKTPFYWASDNEKVFFQEDDSKVLLFVYGKEAEKRTKEISKANKIKVDDLPENTKDQSAPGGAKFYLNVPKESKSRDEFLDGFTSLANARFREHGLQYYITKPIIKGENTVEGLLNELIVKFKSHVTREEVHRIAKANNFEVVRSVKYLGNTYVLRYGKYPNYEMLRTPLSNKEELPIIWVEPNRIETITNDLFIPNDFLYSEQPHFGVINADDAWDTLDDININIRSGSPDITIAVFDPNGVSPSHPDLTGTLTDGTAKMVANFDFTNWQNQTVALLGGDHGTECASSATGQFNNSTGATGLAGNCHLIGARLGATLTDQADAWIWAAGFQTGNTNPAFPGAVSRPADVISNSWGSNGSALSNTYRDTFDFLTSFGRNGRGCIVCFSIGNNGYVDFTTHATLRRMYAAYEKTIAIGASINANPTNPVNSSHPDQNGNTNNLPASVDTRAYYNPFGPALDIVSPSHTSYAPAKIDPILSAVIEDTGDIPSGAVASSTLQAIASAGSNTIILNSTAGFAAGEFLVIGFPGSANREYFGINSIAGNTITLNGNLANAQPAGTVVSSGPNDYEFDFGGTSHSCPTVAGAAALVLSVRPTLNWVQVREILRTTAAQIDFTQANATGQWVDLDGDAIPDFSQWYGYGRLDVDAAVQTTRDMLNFQDVVIRDNLTDVGIVPSNGWHAHSPDVWVRQSDDPIPALAYNAAPPHQNALRGQDNYVFLRVRNFGTAATNEVYLRALITHFPGFEFRYPQEWQPSNRPGQALPSPLEPGTYLIGEQLIDNLAIGTDTIIKMTWDQNLIPPASVMVGGINVEWHPCILAEISPHDGPNPSTTGHAVKDNNNLAHRNIRIDDPGDDISGDDFAVAVVAGTSDVFGVQSIILDRTFLPDNYDVFIRVEDENVMNRWIKAVKANEIKSAPVLPGSEEGPNDQSPNKDSRREACGVTILDPTRLSVKCCDGNQIIIHVPGKTLIENQCKESKKDKPGLKVGRYQNKEVLVYTGGSKAVSLPFALPSNVYAPVVIGMNRPSGERAKGYLKATQQKTNGELSAGYTIEG